MSADKEVTSDVMKVLEDGKDGFSKAAELVSEKSPDAALTFRRLSDQRSSFYDELQKMAKDYGDPMEESGTIAAAVHRGWMSVKNAVSGSDAGGVFDVAVEGETHAVETYQNALKDPDLSAGLRLVLNRQLVDVTKAHAEVTGLRDTTKLQAA